MRSAETSGVGAKGFAVRNAGSTGASILGTLIDQLRHLVEHISPVTLAVALTAMVAASASVVADLTRTAHEVERHQAVMAQFAPAEANPQLLHNDAVVGVWQRGSLAFAAALLAVGLTLRRRTPMRSGVELRRFEDFLSAVPFGVACWTHSGRLVVCNPQYATHLHGDGPEVRAGTSYHHSINRLARGGYVQLISDDRRSRTLEIHRQDGTCLLLEERPLANGGFVTLVTDVTERRRTDSMLASIREEQRQLARRYHEEKIRAEAASRSKTSFLAHLSHDIRTPLNHIIGFAELMRTETYGPLGDPRYRNYVDAVKGSGERLLSFFASILELAELEGGSKPLRREEFDADDMLASVVRRFASEAQRAGVVLGLGAPVYATLLGDRFVLERMLGNVVDNAIRFTPTGGRVSIAAFAAADGVVLEVTDTGVGMSEDRIASLSQPFAFGDAACAREHGGAGLGLPIARAIAELSGGRLAIDSRPTLGTTVAISLPLLVEVEQARAA